MVHLGSLFSFKTGNRGQVFTINIWFIGFGWLVIVLFRSHPAILLSVEGLVSIMFWGQRSCLFRWGAVTTEVIAGIWQSGGVSDYVQFAAVQLNSVDDLINGCKDVVVE